MTEFYYVLSRVSDLIGEDFFFDNLKSERFTKESYVDYPKTNHSVDDKGIQTLEVATTGFDKSELKLEIKQNKLFISGKKNKEEKADKRIYLNQSIAQRSFSIYCTLNDKIDIEGITSKYENGLLIITIPPKEEITKHDRELSID